MAPTIFSGGRELCSLMVDFGGSLLRTIIMPINVAELRKNTAQGAIAATINHQLLDL